MKGCRNFLHRFTPAVAVALIAGCVAAPSPPLTELAVARAAIIQAEQAGAEQAAPAQLNVARERLVEAQELAPTDEALARWRAKEAESDARLAEAAAHDARARVAVAALDRTGADRGPVP